MTNFFLSVVVEFWKILGDMAPYLLLGFLMAGVLSVLVSPDKIQQHLGKHRIWSIVKATILGIPLVLCSCSVIPIAASLRKHGASRGATSAFLASTPETGVDSFFATLSLFGPVFAVFRVLIAVINGIISGIAVTFFEEKSKTDNTDTEECHDECCAGDNRGSKFYRILRYSFITLPKEVAQPLLVGLLTAGIIIALLPKDYLAIVLGKGFLTMLLMLLLSIPTYVCATGSVAIAAALVAKGISPGAALVFLLVGPATNITTILTMWKIVGKRSTIIYVITIALTALASGLLLDYIFQLKGVKVSAYMGEALPDYVKSISALVLLVVLGYAVYRNHNQHQCSNTCSHDHHHNHTEEEEKNNEQ